MSAEDFTRLADLVPNETVTHSYVQDIELPTPAGKQSPGTFALITLDNGLDHSKPTTLGPNTLVELGKVLEGLRERADRGEIVGVGVTGKPYYLVAGADLSAVKNLDQREHGRSEAYKVVLMANDKTYTHTPDTLAEYRRFQPGSKWKLTVNALGGVSNVQPAD